MKKRILILEDDVRLALQWSRALVANGFEVLVTHSGTEALAVFLDNAVDLCIVDLLVEENGKPSSNGGLTFLGKMGAGNRKNTKILGVSGVSQSFLSVDAKQHLLTFGAEEFLAKPFTDAELVEQILLMLD